MTIAEIIARSVLGLQGTDIEERAIGIVQIYLDRELAELKKTADALEAALRTEYATTHRIVTAYDRLQPVLTAAKALCAQPMLVKGDDATWGDVAQSHVEGPKLLSALMTAVAAVEAAERDSLDSLRSQLTATQAALVEACDIGERAINAVTHPTSRARIAELRKLGGKP